MKKLTISEFKSLIKEEAQKLHKSERNYAAVALIMFPVSAVFGLLTTNALLGLVAQV